MFYGASPLNKEERWDDARAQLTTERDQTSAKRTRTGYANWRLVMSALKGVAMEVSKRYRVNVGISTKGQKTWDCTVELTNDGVNDGSMINRILLESDELVAELDHRYPPVISEK